MAGDWIKMRGNLWDDPRVARLCDLTDQGEAMVIGGLYWLWAAADQHTESGEMFGLSLRQIDRKTGIPGFGQALHDIGWIEEIDGGVRIVRFDEHNGASAKRRSMEAKRKASVRKVSASKADKKRTRSGRDAELEIEKEIDKPPTSSPARDDRPRFRMNLDWQPSGQMGARLKISGVPPDMLTDESLGEFKSYWLTRDDELTHDQWEHKLVQCLIKLHRRMSHEDRGEHRNSRDAVRAAIHSGDKSWATGL